MAELPEDLIETPSPGPADLLSQVLASFRLSGAMQFCLMPAGAWYIGAGPSLASFAERPDTAVPFHIVVAGNCWIEVEGQRALLAEGDIVGFPFGTRHVLGAGQDGASIAPTADLPPQPWRQVPILTYGGAPERVRLLCGYLQCDAMSFAPLRQALPKMLHVRTAGTPGQGWLAAIIGQIAREIDAPRTGSLSMLQRLTEIAFIEMLRHEIDTTGPGARGWLAALADPGLGRSLALIHDQPAHDWTLESLARRSGLSRTTLGERFDALLGLSPMRYVRDWRLCLASIALATTTRPIAAIADEAGYGTEAAFSRAFSRQYGFPPALYRAQARQGKPAARAGA